MPKDFSQFVFVVGPTAVGKTELSLKIAQRWSLPIINFDSIQVYQKVNIGSAKPSKEELSQAEHYLFDYIAPPTKQTASSYVSDLSKLLLEQKFKSAVFVGGSGFYLQAIEKGLYPNSETRPEITTLLNERLNSEGFAGLFQWLQEKDPVYASKISVNDHYRVKRAVEVMLSQEKTMTELKHEMSLKSYSPLPDHRSIKVGLKMDKLQLRERVEVRTRKMLEAGFVAEVEELLAQGLENWAPMSSVGYKEVQTYLLTHQTLDELFENIVTSSMQLIKKQMTWFKKDSSIHWFAPAEMEAALEKVAEHFVINAT